MNIILIIVLSIIIIGGLGVGSYFLVKKLKHKSSGSGTTRVCPKNSKFPFLDKKTNKCISGDDHCNSLNPPQVYNSKSYECESCKSPTPFISNIKPYKCLTGDDYCKQQIPPQIFNNGSCIDGDEYCNTLDPPQVFDKKSVSCKPCKPNDIMITTSTPYTCSPGKEYCNKLRPPQDFDLTTQKCVYKKCKEKEADCPSTNIIYNPSPDVCECLTPNDYCKTISPSTPYNIPSPSTTIKCGNAKDLKNYCNSINEYYDTSSTSGKCMDAGYFCTSELEGTYSPAEGTQYDMGDKCYPTSPPPVPKCPKKIHYDDKGTCVTSPIDDNVNGCCFSKEGTRFPNITQIEGIYAIEMIADSGFKYILSQNSGSDTNTNPQLIGSQDDTTGVNVGNDIYYNYWKIFKATSSSNMLYTNGDKPYILQNMQTGKYMTYNNTVPINLRVDDQPSKFYIEGNPFSIVNKDSSKIYFNTNDGTQTKKHYLQISANPPNQVMTGDYGSALYFRQIPYEPSSGSDNLPFFMQSQEDLITPSPAFCSKCNCKENCNDFKNFPCINNKQCNIINELKGTPSPAYCYKKNLTFDNNTNQCGSTTEIPDSSLSPSEKIQYMLNARQDKPPQTKFECENYSNILGINDAQLPNWKWYDKTNISPSLSPVLEKLKIKQDPGICILESDTNSLCGLNQNNDCSLFATNSLKYCKDKNTDAETYSVCLDNPNTSPSTENIYPNNNVIKDTCNEGDKCVIPSQLCINDDNNIMTCYNGSWTEYKNDPEKQLKNFNCDKNKDYIGYYNTTFNKYCSVSKGVDIASFTDTYQPLKLQAESDKKTCDYQGTVGVFNDGQNDNVYYCKKVYDNVGTSSLQWIKQDNANVNLEGNTMKKTWSNLYTNKTSSDIESNNFESCVANVGNTCSSGVDNGNYRCNTINKSNVGVCGLSNCNLTQSPSPSIDNICVDASQYTMNKQGDKCIINRNLEQNIFKENDKCNYKTQWICGGQYTGFQNTDVHPYDGLPTFPGSAGVCKGQNTPSGDQNLSNLEVYQSVNPLGRGANCGYDVTGINFNMNVLEEPYGDAIKNLNTATSECDNDPDCIGISQTIKRDYPSDTGDFYKFKKLGGESPSDSVSQYVTKPGLSNNSMQQMGKYFDFTLKDSANTNWGGYPNTLQDPWNIGVKGYSTYEEALNSIISSPAEGNKGLTYGDVTCVPTTESPSQFCMGKSNPYLMITKEGEKYYPDQKIISGSVNGQMGNPNDPNTSNWWENTLKKNPGTPMGYGPSNISTCIRVPCYNNECCNEGNTNPKLSYIYPCNSPSCFNIREMVTNSN